MAFKLAEAFVEIRAPLSRMIGDLKTANTSLAVAARRMGDAAEVTVPVAIDTGGFKEGLAEARKLARHAVEHIGFEKAAHKLVGANPGYSAFAGAKAGVDLGAGKAADVTIRVAQDSLRAGLAAAAAAVRGAAKAMTAMLVLPFTIAHVGLKIGLGVAQALLFKKVKEMTGASTVQIVLAYAAFRVSLKIAQKLLGSAVRSMARLAMVPVRLSLNVLAAGLRTARAMVAGAARQMASVASIPFRLAGAALSPVGLGVAGVGAVAGAAGAILGSVKAASDLNETISKVGFSFGKSAKIVTDGADEMAAKFGVPKREFLDGAAAIGLIGKASGIADSKAATMGVHFAKLAADAASFYNIPVDEALEKIRAGLVGEAEPLRTLGVLLSEDAVKARGLAMGLKLAHGELSQGDKVLARAAIITAGLATAQGDLARTADSLANRMREVWGRVQNLAASMGQFLLPAAQSLSAAFAEVAVGLAATIEKGKSSLAAWGDSIKAAADKIGVLIRNFSELRKIALPAIKIVLSNAFENVKSVLTAFAQRIGFEIERAIQTALHAAAPRLFNKWVPRETPGMPKLKSLTEGVAENPTVKAGLDATKANEAARINRAPLMALVEPLKAAVGTALAVAGGARAAGEAYRRRRQEVAEGNTGFEAARQRREEAAARATGGRASAESVYHPPVSGKTGEFMKPPKESKKEATVDDALKALSTFNANLMGAQGGLAGGGVAAAAASAALAQVAPAMAASAGEKKEKQSAEFVGLSDFAKKIQVGALDKDNLQKQANGLLNRIAAAVEDKGRGRGSAMAAVAAP